MEIKEFLNLSINKANSTASMPVVADNCTVLSFLYGGAALAASLEVMEELTGRPNILATCQFNNFAKVGGELSIKVEESVRGNNVCHASLIANVGDMPVFKTLGTFGRRQIDTQAQFIDIPNLDSPENCPGFGSGRIRSDKPCIDRRMDIRVARGSLRKDKQVKGQMALWARIPELDRISSASIALMADYLPVSAGSLLGRTAGGNSLDNSLRILNVEQTDWILCDCELRGIQNGFGHATMNMWAQSGALLAVASQSFIFREFDFKKG